MNKTDFLVLFPGRLVLYFFIPEQSIYCTLVRTFLNVAVNKFYDYRSSIFLYFLDPFFHFFSYGLVAILDEQKLGIVKIEVYSIDLFLRVLFRVEAYFNCLLIHIEDELFDRKLLLELNPALEFL